MEGLWKVSGRCLGGVWEVWGKCWEVVGKLFWMRLDSFWKLGGKSWGNMLGSCWEVVGITLPKDKKDCAAKRTGWLETFWHSNRIGALSQARRVFFLGPSFKRESIEEHARRFVRLSNRTNCIYQRSAEEAAAAYVQTLHMDTRTDGPCPYVIYMSCHITISPYGHMTI